MNTVIAAASSYVLGSISFPGTYAKIRGINLWKHGEGHLGATSVLTATKSPALFLMLGLLDASKGLIAYHLFGPLGLLFAMLGHMFPIFFKFRGGNAVSVYYGGAVLVNPLLVLACASIELMIAKLVRNNWRHAIYLAIRAAPAIMYAQIIPAYLLLLLRHAWFYYVKFHQGSS